MIYSPNETKQMIKSMSAEEGYDKVEGMDANMTQNIIPKGMQNIRYTETIVTPGGDSNNDLDKYKNSCFHTFYQKQKKEEYNNNYPSKKFNDYYSKTKNIIQTPQQYSKYTSELIDKYMCNYLTVKDSKDSQGIDSYISKKQPRNERPNERYSAHEKFGLNDQYQNVEQPFNTADIITQDNSISMTGKFNNPDTLTQEMMVNPGSNEVMNMESANMDMNMQTSIRHSYDGMNMQELPEASKYAGMSTQGGVEPLKYETANQFTVY